MLHKRQSLSGEGDLIHFEREEDPASLPGGHVTRSELKGRKASQVRGIIGAQIWT